MRVVQRDGTQPHNDDPGRGRLITKSQQPAHRVIMKKPCDSRPPPYAPSRRGPMCHPDAGGGEIVVANAVPANGVQRR